MMVEVENYIREQNKILENISEFKTIIIKCSFKEDKIALKCCFTDMYDYTDKIIYALKNEDTDKTIEAISEWINHIVEGVRIVRELNRMIKKHQKEYDSTIRVIYKFGYSNDDTVRVIDWDYTKVIIKLNKTSICNLINYCNNLIDILNIDDYICSVVKFINNFNSMKMHSVIGANLDGSTVDILTCNMITREDVINMITNNPSTKGVQKIKSVFSIHELGILAIFMWNIDFKYGIVEISLMDDKMLNAIDDTYIRDKDICDAILRLYEIKAKEIYSLFKVNDI